MRDNLIDDFSNDQREDIETVGAYGSATGTGAIGIGAGLTQLTGDSPLVWGAAGAGVLGIAILGYASTKIPKILRSIPSRSAEFLALSGLNTIGVGAAAYGGLELLLERGELWTLAPFALGLAVAGYSMRRVAHGDYFGSDSSS